MKGRGRGRKGGGGARQRALAAASAPSGAPSHLVEELVQLWCWGGMSPQTVQKLAAGARKDVLTVQQQTVDFVLDQVRDYVPPELLQSILAHNATCGLAQLDKVAGIGSAGAHPNNCNRDLTQLLRGYRFSKPTVEHIPMAMAPGKTQVQQKAQCFLWPHEMFAALYEKYPDMFASSVYGGHGIQQFWTDMEDSRHPALLNHPMRGGAKLEQFVYPFISSWRRGAC